MPGTGGRPDIGAYAVWHRLALSAESPELHGLALAADGNGLASFPIHRRETGSHKIGAPFDSDINKTIWDGMLGRRSAMTYERLGSCPFHPDYAHTPSTSFYGYLTTGDKFFEEELAFWGMYPSYVWPHTGIVPGTTRAAAWQLRNATDAAFLLPDDHQRKQYLGEYVDRNLADMRRRLDERGHLLSGPRECSGRQHWVCSGQTSIWQYTWLIWSLDNTARKGWLQSSQVRDDAADVLLRMYDGQEAFTAPNGKTYRFEFKGGMPYSLATDLIRVEYGDNGQEQDTLLRPISNTAEMYYYTLVNISNMHYFSDRQKQQAWIDSLPSKTMRPEDWKLDPAVEAKGTGGLSHEYGNSECSAALARYDNPRSQKMYDFVRKTIEEAPRRDEHLYRHATVPIGLAQHKVQADGCQRCCRRGPQCQLRPGWQIVGRSFDRLPLRRDRPTAGQMIDEEFATGIATGERDFDRVGASKTLANLTEVASMGMKVPHGDTNALEYHMKDGALAALNNIQQYAKPWLVLLATIKVHEDKMLERARSGYSAATELANELVRRDGLDYRTAHDVVQTFILESVRQGLPSCEAKVDILQAAAEEVAKKQLSMSESQLREALDPVHFVNVTNCRGGVAPKEVARMIEVRRKRLAEARARHLARIEQLENSKAQMLADLHKLAGSTSKEKPE